MGREQEKGLESTGTANYKFVAKEAVADISKNVQDKYSAINLQKIPDHVSYSKVEKYLRSIDVEVTRKMFFSYLREGLIPAEHEVKNARYSYYTKEQIIYYILIDMFKSILPLSKVKLLFGDLLQPMIIERGLEATFETLSKLITSMVKQFSETVTAVMKSEEFAAMNIPLKTFDVLSDEDQKSSHADQYANLVTLCMAKGALDFYKHSPDALLE